MIQPEFDDVHFEFYKGVACVKQKEKLFFINEAGKAVSKQFDEVGYFDANDLCIVGINQKYGIVNTSGELTLDAKYTSIGDFDANGLAMINLGGTIAEDGTLQGGKYGFISTSGSIVVEPCYSFIGERDRNGLRWINVGGVEDEHGRCSGGKYGYIDDNAKEVIAPNYTFIGTFDDSNICWVCIGGKEFISDKTIDAQVNSYAQREKNPAKVMAKRIELENQITGGKLDILDHKVMGGKYGFISATGAVIAEPIYTATANSFHEGCAWVALGDKYGYVNSEGKLIAECIYDQVAPRFSEGVAWAKKTIKKESLFGYINTKGEPITEFCFAKVNNIKDGFANLPIPGLSEIPLLGYGIFNHNVLVYLGIVIALVMWWYLNRTTPGLKLRAVGENPATADAAGINVTRYKYLATMVGSAIAGLGGLQYVFAYANGVWSNNAFGDRGWLAIALVIFAIWRPNVSILGSILFGGLFIVYNYIPDLSLSSQELFKMTPYVVTILVLIITSMRQKKESQPPASLGLPYFREER